jgi:hypothetical protein
VGLFAICESLTRRDDSQAGLCGVGETLVGLFHVDRCGDWAAFFVFTSCRTVFESLGNQVAKKVVWRVPIAEQAVFDRMIDLDDGKPHIVASHDASSDHIGLVTRIAIVVVVAVLCKSADCFYFYCEHHSFLGFGLLTDHCCDALMVDLSYIQCNPLEPIFSDFFQARKMPWQIAGKVVVLDRNKGMR